MRAEPPVIAAGLQAVSVVLSGGAPISYVDVPLRGGVTLLYGTNGVGKTTILDGVDAAFSGVARRSGEARLVCRTTSSGLGWNSQLLPDLAQLVSSAGGSDFNGVEDALLAMQGEAFGGFEPWDESALEFVRDWVNEGLAAIAAGHVMAAGGQYDLTLVAVGTVVEPAWDVYVSSLRDFTPEMSIMAEHLSREKFADGYEFFPIAVQDVVELAEAGLTSGHVRHKLLGRVPATDRLRAARAADNFDIEQATLAFIRARYRNDYTDPWDTAADIAENISHIATALFHDMTGFDNQLRYSVNDPSTWIEDGIGRWELHETPATWVPAERLGSGLRRWAVLAVRFSLSDVEVPAVVLVDEPEAGLHPLAVRTVVSALEASDGMRVLEPGPMPIEQVISCVIASTHHPAVLSASGAHLLHVTRNAADHTILEPLDNSADPTLLAEALGWSMPDVLLMTRVFVLVEGLHDQAVIEAVFGDELEALRARVVVMGGASNVGHHINAEFFAKYTSARIVVVLDRLGQKATELWDQARAAAAGGDITAALRHLEAITRREGREADWLGDAGRTALLAGHIDRISVVGLEKNDIILYLPVNEFVPSAESWRAVGSPPKGADFKSWLRDEFGAVINVDRLRSIASTIDDLGDLRSILDPIIAS